ncbi:lantibiotic dehydratase [Streptomyces sp. NPDC057307]|uniref:lantibiotic dehydratase n=1 Tax=Streptomyces sp. NPDC057307 TaxID=3346096 RepID=UPI003630C1AA
MSDDRTSHLTPLSGTSWSLWRRAAVRSAGFTADRVLAVTDDEFARLADKEGDTAPPSPSYQEGYARAWQRVSDRLAVVCRDARFREAVTWQNPDAVVNSVENVALAPCFDGGVPPSKHRKRLLTATSYLQRYALKNDSIGFFGPVGWARLTDEAPPLRVTTGPTLLARRTVYFEHWAIDAVADAFAGDPGLKPFLRPVPSPENAVLHGTVITASGRHVALSELERLVVRACDGSRDFAEVADHVADRHEGCAPAPEVLRVLDDLRDRGILVADLRVSPGERPEEQLREHLSGLPASGPRDRALAALADLNEARGRVARAAGDPGALRTAMADLHTAFSEVSGVAANRRPGAMYAGRTPVYEDTVRDVRIDLGKPLLDAVSAPLELLLESARWFTWEVARAYEERFGEVFSRICARTGRQSVPLARLLAALTPDLVFSFKQLPPLVERSADLLRRKWSAILDIPSGLSRYEVSASTLRETVLREFASPAARWSGALRHSPDLMIAAGSPEAIARGEFLAVLGELHVSANTLEARAFVAQARDPAWLRAAEAADHAGRRVVSLPSRNSSGVNSRTHPSALYTSEFTYWTMFSDVVDRPDGLLPAGCLDVIDRAGRLRVVSRLDGREFDLFEVLGETLGWAAMNGFSMLTPARHHPRVTVDRLVVARESWRFDAAELEWARQRDGGDRFLGARRWRARHAIPERCFYSLPTEPKPQFVDFTSLVLVDLFARGLKRAADAGGSVGLTEMLPDLHETWLTDGTDGRYTCELRLVAVDRKGEQGT